MSRSATSLGHFCTDHFEGLSDSETSMPYSRELINAWLRDSAHPETDVEAVFLHSRSSQRRRRPMAYGPSKRPSVDRDEPITPTQSA
ncbi:hypothetical protein CFE70_010676 [Pyrenophora teres f. teres 0-1]